MSNPADRSVENRMEATEDMGAWADYEAYLDSLLPVGDEDYPLYDEDTEWDGDYGMDCDG